jgi:uncharacterized membrane protein YcaP (DUF421 family)
VTQVSNFEFVVAFAIAAVAGGAVWIHADRHGSRHPTAWAMLVTLFLAIALPVYVIHYRRAQRG